LGLDIPKELTMEMAGSPDNHIVGANGNPKKMYELTLMIFSASLEAVLRTK
jgi:hypothetical protein